jgi:hypothetical protein
MTTWDNTKRFRAHPKQTFADGTKATGVTTILGGVLAKPALYRWNNIMGLKGIDTLKYVDEKARAGSYAHEMILSHLAKVEPDHSQYSQHERDQAENSFIKYLDWEKKHTVEPILTEKGMVSELHRYGGIIDFYGLLDGIPTLVDFKTAKAIYPEMWYQVAAYKQMLEEAGHTVVEARILQIGRDDTEGFNEQARVDLKLQFELFTHALAIFNLMKQLKGE